jgi:nucleoside-diphosphate-sugar epimerase
MTKVLITGASGFLGSNFTRRCLNEGFETHVLLRKTSNKWRIMDVLPELHKHEIDLCNCKKLAGLLEKIEPNVILHLAADGTFPTVQKDVDRVIATNFIGSVNLLRATDNVNYSSFINFGSSSEYGVKNLPMVESDIPEPMSVYGATKASSTLLFQTWAKINSKPIVTVRPFSVYGYFEEPMRLIPSTIWHCLHNKDLELGTGAKSMDFIFVEDVIEACMRLIDAPGLGGEIINLGTGEGHTVREVVDRIVSMTNSNIKLQWGKLPSRPYTPEIWVSNTSKMENLLKWKPQYNLDQGLKKTINWMKDNNAFYETQK